jgi:phosphoserine aminotransferase
MESIGCCWPLILSSLLQERVARAVAENMSDILSGGNFVGVVNAPDLGAVASVPKFVPYVLLGERIGSMHAQLLQNNKIGSMSINLRGKDVADMRLADVIKVSVLRGALKELVERNVTYINASSIADELGLNVQVNMSEITEETSGYMNTVKVELEIEGFLNASRVIEGTVFGLSELRITKIDGFTIELPPGEHMLLFNNYDKPGVLRKVADRLAKENINIAHFSLGRKKAGEIAMGALVLDSAPSAEAIEDLRAMNDIRNIIMVTMDNNVDPSFRVNAPQGIVSGSMKPPVRPLNAQFSSGPCKKRPGYSLSSFRTDVLGRSHRSKLGKMRLKKAIDDTKRILGLPDDYLCGIVPASDTGAFEMAMWNLLGPRPVDACYWESFGKGWKEDAVKHLKLTEVNDFTADYGKIPDLTKTNPEHDILFTFNGTTSGVRVPNLDWISDSRTGLTFNDCTSAAFAMDIDWSKTDVSTYSWQKVLGGEVSLCDENTASFLIN